MRIFRKKSNCEKLITAINNGNIKKSLNLIENMTQDDFNIRGSKLNFTALMIAAINNRIEIAKKLIEKMDDVSQQDSNGDTALTLAIFNDNDEIANMLIDKMDNISKQNNYGSTALVWAIRKGKDKIAKKIIDKMDNLCIRDANKKTALIWATYMNNNVIAEELITKMEDISQRDYSDKTALDIAIENGNKELEKILKLKMGDYDTTLLYLLENGELDKAQKLVKDKAPKSKHEWIKEALKTQNVRMAELALLTKDMKKTVISEQFDNLSTKDMQKLSDAFSFIAKKLAFINMAKNIGNKGKFTPKR